MNIARRRSLLCALALAAIASPASAGLTLTFENAGVQSSLVSGITTENFDAFANGGITGPIAVGTLSTLSGAGGTISLANQYGGAGGTGKYINAPAIGAPGKIQLSLSGAQSYFGFWWSAADSGNLIRFYNGASLLGSFNAATTLSSLGAAYDGNPNSGLNVAQKYAYLNIFGTSGTTFDRIEFENINSGSGLELDNFSVRATAVPPTGTEIPGGIEPAPVPEPSTLVLGALAGLGLVTMSLRRRRLQKIAA